MPYRLLLILVLFLPLLGCSDPNERNEKGQTKLNLAAEAGDLALVKSLLDDGAATGFAELKNRQRSCD